MDGISFRGRGYHVAAIAAEVFEESVRIRIDDDSDPELWVEVTLSSAALAELLSRVIVTRPNYEPESLRVLEVLGRTYSW